jgi:hypothetical protein
MTNLRLRLCLRVQQFVVLLVVDNPRERTAAQPPDPVPVALKGTVGGATREEQRQAGKRGKLVKANSLSADEPGRVSLNLKPTEHARQRLEEQGKHNRRIKIRDPIKMRGTIRVRFIPNFGDPAPATTLRAKIEIRD